MTDHTPTRVKDLVAAPYNPRQISSEQLDRLGKAMHEFGDLSGIVYNRRTGHLIAGHQRVKKLDPESFVLDSPVVGEAGAIEDKATGERWTYREVDWDEQKEMAANLAANRQGGEWDELKLGKVLEEIVAFGGDLDLDLTGFDGQEIESRMLAAGGGGIKEDDVPEPPENPITRPGDIWCLGEHRVMCGDATDQAAVDKLTAGVKVESFIVDPPYGMRLDADFSGMKNKLKFAQEKGIKSGTKYEQVVGDHKDFDAQPIIACFGSPSIQFWFGADYYSSTLPDAEHSGAWLVWDKRLDEKADRMFGSCFELIWTNKKCKRAILRHKWAGIFGTEKEPQRGRQHPNQKPIVLLADIVGRTKGLIADPCAGAGSTLIAAEQIGRTVYAMEILPQFVDVTVQRWQNLTGRKAERKGAG